MLGIYEVAADRPIEWHHISFRVSLEEMSRAAEFLRERGITPRNQIDQGESPQVFCWMPAVSLFFDDPDGHLLEFIAMLPDAARPEPPVRVLWETWRTGV
jgi:catechol 2,3-dioxygenase-like lactoylglutathione lyase family enzyme